MMTEPNSLTWIFLILLGYFSGSVMYCDFIAKHFSKKDLYQVSKDGNPGAANVFWHCGWKLGMLGLVLDILKGFVPVFIAVHTVGIANIAFSLVMLAPILGHAFPFGKLKKGGKCISTSYGVFTALIPYSPAVFVLAFLNIFFAYIAKIKVGNVRALVMYGLLCLVVIPISFRAQLAAVALGCLLISATVVSRHLPLTAPEERPAAEKIAKPAKS